MSDIEAFDRLPMEVKECGNRLPRAAKLLGSAPLCELFSRALVNQGFDFSTAASLLGIAPSQFSKEFSSNWPDHAPALKRMDKVPLGVKQAFYAFGAADCGLQVGLDYVDKQALQAFYALLKRASE